MSVLGRAIAVALSSKSNAFVFQIGYSSAMVDLRNAALSAGWDGTKKVIAVIPTGRIICPNAGGGYGQNGVHGLTVSGSFPGGVKLQLQPGASLGGSGGSGGQPAVGPGNGNSGGNGGTALVVTVALTVDNRGTIAGAGGAGASGGGAQNPDLAQLHSGGGGQGQDLFYPAGNQSSGDAGYGGCHAGGGGGGGTHGSAGAAGTSSVSWDVWPGGYSSGSPGTGGNAVTGNSYITWENTGTRYGAIAA